MAHAHLPIHPRTCLRAVGIVNGRPVWPILGGDDGDDAAAQAAAKAAADAAQAAADSAAADRGFPENTPLEQMKPEQREAYWKHQARKHEDRVKAYGGRTPEQIAEAFEKANKHDALELELGTTADKAAAKAADDAKAAAFGELQPEVITARLDAAAARAGVTEEDLAKAVEFVDTAKFLDAAGNVDTDKVKAFVATIAPAKGNEQQQRRPGPSSNGQGGSRGSSAGPAQSLAAGRELYRSKFARSKS